jgi:hypothetical protein
MSRISIGSLGARSLCYSQSCFTYPQGCCAIRRIASLIDGIRFAYPQDTLRYNRTMLKRYHVEITRLALGEYFSANAIEKITAANLHQDRLLGQIGHAEFHFDNSAFEKSYQYVEKQRALTVSALETHDALSAWSAFGRLTHAVQDFYSHSNYVDLWLKGQANGTTPTPSAIDPIDPHLLNSPSLNSGRVYLPLEVFYLFPRLRPLLLRILPRDSHAWMNLDSPQQGPNFEYTFQAAVKRTKIEFQKTTNGLPEELFGLFVDKPVSAQGNSST